MGGGDRPRGQTHPAAAIHGSADVLLSRNLKRLRTKPALAASVEVMTADDFLCVLLTKHREGLVESFIRDAERSRCVGITPQATAAQYRRDGIVCRPLQDASPVAVQTIWIRGDPRPRIAPAVALLTEEYRAGS